MEDANDTEILKQEEEQAADGASEFEDQSDGAHNSVVSESAPPYNPLPSMLDSPATREAAPPPAGSEEENCAICLSPVVDAVTLPCTHSYCGTCLIKMRRFGVTDTCPVCRTKLPGAAELCDEATLLIVRVERIVDQEECNELRKLALEKLAQAHRFDPHYKRAHHIRQLLDPHYKRAHPSNNSEAAKLCQQAVSLISAVEDYAGAEREGALADAEQLLQEALTKDPAYAMAHMNLGMVYRANGDPKSEIEHYKR
jgi:tetratricopeptide (TPR) repeat protein